MLSSTDTEFLEGLNLDYELTQEGGMVCVVIKGWSPPPGYEPQQVDLLLRLPSTFPDSQPDMYWCDPEVRVAATGALPQAADLFEEHLGRRWQRFSRHLNPGAWKPGRDSLASYLALITQALVREAS